MAAPFLQVDSLAKSYGDNLLFADVSFSLSQGDKVGLIARNGAGKSTLLRILAGEEGYDSGVITFARGVSVGFLSQEPRFDPERSILDNVMPPAAADDWSAPDRAREMLHRLGVDDFSASPAHMSGGQLKRAAIARVLLAEPQLLMLDEPTNHLDIETVEWLEGYLSTRRTTLLMVTHDRWFLDCVCNRIIEIDRQGVFSYEGNYDYYLTRRAERMEALGAELAKVRNLLRTEHEWMRRQPQARGHKAKYRVDAFHDLKQRSQVNLDQPEVSVAVKGSYIGSKIFEAKGVGKAFGDKVILRDWSYTFARYDKIGIVGPNGAGKTTLLRMLLGELAPDSGSFDIGQTVRWGYYSQKGIVPLEPGRRVIDAVRDIAEEVWLDEKTRLSASQFLNHFLFSVPDQQKYIERLSGGERRRLNLAVTLMRSPNFLIFDEPTNDLDILTLSILEDYLRRFHGCVIVVSHDRFFLDRIVNHLFVMRGDGAIEDFPGNYTQWRGHEKLRQERLEDSEKGGERRGAPAQRQRSRRESRGLTFAQRREKEGLETVLPALEKEKEELEARMSSGTMSSDEIVAAGERMALLIADIDEKEMRLLELMELDS